MNISLVALSRLYAVYYSLIARQTTMVLHKLATFPTAGKAFALFNSISYRRDRKWL